MIDIREKQDEMSSWLAGIVKEAGETGQEMIKEIVHSNPELVTLRQVTAAPTRTVTENPEPEFVRTSFLR